MQTSVSPFELLPFLDIDKFLNGELTYPDVRKRVLAEFSLNDNQPLEIKGKSIGKSEALRVAEVFKNPEEVKSFLELEKSTDLKDFLAGANLDYVLLKSNFKKEIPSIVQEQFQEKFNETISREYTSGEFELVAQLFLFPIEELITTSTEQTATDVLYKKVKLDLIELQEIANKPTLNDRFNALKICVRSYTKEKAAVINLLPEQFGSLRHEIGVLCINLSYDIYNNHKKRNIPKLLSRFVMFLDTDKELVKIAKDNWQVFNDHAPRSTRRESSSGGWGNTIWIIIVLAKLVFIIAKCAN